MNEIPIFKLLEWKEEIQKCIDFICQGLISELNCDIEIDDQFNETALFFQLSTDFSLLGACRVILPSPKGFPLESVANFPLEVNRYQTAELSRLYLDKKSRIASVKECYEFLHFSMAKVNKISENIDFFIIESIITREKFYEKVGFMRVSEPFFDPAIKTNNFENAVLMGIEFNRIKTLKR